MLRHEHDDGGGQDDPVRDDPPLEVGRGDRDEHGAEERGDEGVPGERRTEHAAGDEQRRAGLDERVAPRDRRAAVAAAAAQHSVRDERDVVVPRDRRRRSSCTPSRARRSSGAAGTRAATTFRKLPTARPGAKTTAASATFIAQPVRRSSVKQRVRGGSRRARRQPQSPRRPARRAPSRARGEREHEVVRGSAPRSRRSRGRRGRRSTSSISAVGRASACRRTSPSLDRRPGCPRTGLSRISSAMRLFDDHHLDRGDPAAARPSAAGAG